MIVDDDTILREFHNTRIKEHIPAQYFINQHNLLIKRHSFLAKYSKWRRLNSLPFVNLDVTQYLQWMEKHYNMPIGEDIYNHNIITSDTIFQPLTTAATIFITLYPKLTTEVLRDCGLTSVSFNNCRKHILQQGINLHAPTY